MLLRRDLSSLVRSRAYSHISLPYIVQFARRTGLLQGNHNGLPHLFRQGTLSRELKMKAQQRKKAPVPRHKSDKVPGSFSLIYVSSLRHWINGTRLSMTALTGTICSLSLYKLSQMTLSLESLQTLESFFVISTPFVMFLMFALLNMLTRPLFIRIYYNPDIGHFIGVRRTYFGRLKQLDYTVEDISLKRKGKPSPKETWDTASLNIKKTSVLVFSSDFVSPEFYSMHVNGSLYSVQSVAKQHFY